MIYIVAKRKQINSTDINSRHFQLRHKFSIRHTTKRADDKQMNEVLSERTQMGIIYDVRSTERDFTNIWSS